MRAFEYCRGERSFEQEVNNRAQLADLDGGLLARYKDCIGASDLSAEQVLQSRSLLWEENGRARLTNAAVLLFAKDVRQFFSALPVAFRSVRQ